MKIDAKLVKQLRDMSQAGMMDCKKALEEANGDLDKAADILREKGIAKSVKKGDRITAEGLVDAYVHNGRIGVLLEVNSETDFVAANAQFKEFVHHMAMQIAAQAPKYVSREDVPAEVLEHEKEILTEQARNESSNVPEDKREMVAQKKVEGRLEKFFEEICLLDQAYILDPDKTVDQVRKELIATIGENIVIRRFTRYEVGEGLEKRQDDLAAEVAKQLEETR